MYLILLLALPLAPFTSHGRWMNPQTGRFWTMDSYEGEQEDPQTLHPYLYCHNDPNNNADPTGQFTMVEVAGASTIAFGGRAGYEAARTPSYASGLARANAIAQIIAVTYLGYLAADTAFERSGLAEWIRKAAEEVRHNAKYKNMKLPEKLVPIPKTLMPEIAAHIEERQATKPNLIVLRRADVGINLYNRANVLAGLPPAGTDATGRKLSWDEYPFASSVEGGGRDVSVRKVPLSEQWKQGGFIMGSYILEEINPGQKFAVIVIP